MPKKILAKVDTHAPKVDKQEVIKQLASIMRVDAQHLDYAKIAALQGLLGKVGQFAKLPTDKISLVSEILDSAGPRA